MGDFEGEKSPNGQKNVNLHKYLANAFLFEHVKNYFIDYIDVEIT